MVVWENHKVTAWNVTIITAVKVEPQQNVKSWSADTVLGMHPVSNPNPSARKACHLSNHQVHYLVRSRPNSANRSKYQDDNMTSLIY